MQQLILDIHPDAPPSFDNFLSGSNGEALDAGYALAAGHSGERLLYLWGPDGVGKTHLLKAMAGTAAALGLSASYRSACEPLPEDLPAFLAVDDVHALNDDGAQVTLFNLLNQAREQGGRLAAAGDVPPARLNLRPELATRLGWGLVYGLAPLSDTDKLTAMAVRAGGRGMKMGEEVARYLLTHCRRDLPHLLELVDGLDNYSLSLKRPVSLHLARSYLARLDAD